jgi:hypothetical protein
METTNIALIASGQIVLVIIVQAIVLAFKERRDAKFKKLEKEEDYARQDVVAERVAIAAKQAADAAALLLKAQKETISRTDEVARLAAEADERIHQQLVGLDEQGKKIHILVNSDMTAARTAERDSLKLLVIALKRVLSLDSKSESDKDEENKEITRVEERIAELDQILADRLAAQAKVDAESSKKVG